MSAVSQRPSGIAQVLSALPAPFAVIVPSGRSPAGLLPPIGQLVGPLPLLCAVFSRRRQSARAGLSVHRAPVDGQRSQSAALWLPPTGLRWPPAVGGGPTVLLFRRAFAVRVPYSGPLWQFDFLDGQHLHR